MFLSIPEIHLKAFTRWYYFASATVHPLSYPAQIIPRAWHPSTYFAVKFVLNYTEVASPTFTWSPPTWGCRGPVGTKPASHCTEINGSYGRKITMAGTLRYACFSNAARCKKNRSFFLHSNLVGCMLAVKGVTSLHSMRVSAASHRKARPMLKLYEVVLTTNSQEILNSPKNRAIVTMPLGMVSPLRKGKRDSFGQRQGRAQAEKLKAMRHCGGGGSKWYEAALTAKLGHT